jgi:hypothetical protein
VPSVDSPQEPIPTQLRRHFSTSATNDTCRESAPRQSALSHCFIPKRFRCERVTFSYVKRLWRYITYAPETYVARLPNQACKPVLLCNAGPDPGSARLSLVIIGILKAVRRKRHHFPKRSSDASLKARPSAGKEGASGGNSERMRAE